MNQQEDNHKFERELSRILTRYESPDSLSERVMAKVRREPIPVHLTGGAPELPPGHWYTFASWGLIAVTACLLVIFSLPHNTQNSFQAQSEGVVAERQLAEVLQLTGQNWNRARNTAFQDSRTDEK